MCIRDRSDIIQIAPFSMVTLVEHVKLIGKCVSTFRTASFDIKLFGEPII